MALDSLGIAEKQIFFVTLRRLAQHHGRLPDSMMLTERIEVSDQIIAPGGFADVRTEVFKGRVVAVKTTRVTERDNFPKIKKVKTNDIFCHLGHGFNHSTLAVL